MISKFIVSIESQPAIVVNVSLKKPAEVRIKLSQAYGISVSQTTTIAVSLNVGIISKLMVRIESHPDIVVKVSLYIPAEVRLRLSHK